MAPPVEFKGADRDARTTRSICSAGAAAEAFFGSAAGHEREERHFARAFDGGADHALLLCRVARLSAGEYLAALSQEPLKHGHFLVVHIVDLVDGEETDFRLTSPSDLGSVLVVLVAYSVVKGIVVNRLHVRSSAGGFVLRHGRFLSAHRSTLKVVGSGHYIIGASLRQVLYGQAL